MAMKHCTQGYCWVACLTLFAISSFCQASNGMENPQNDGEGFSNSEYENVDIDTLITEGKGDIRKLVKNGNEASFRHLYVNNDMDNPILCGEVNQATPGGNSSGYQRFVHDMGEGSLGFENESEAFPLTWEVFCD
jgi:hypothetical protein